MERLIKRTHENGWIAIVEERLDGDGLTGYALKPDGERHDAPINHFEGGEDDYQERLERAKEAADRAIGLVVGHVKCECPPWPKGGE